MGFSRQEYWSGVPLPSLTLLLHLCSPMDCSPLGSSVQGVLQARVLEWVAMPSSRESPQPRNGTQVSCNGLVMSAKGPGRLTCHRAAVYTHDD